MNHTELISFSDSFTKKREKYNQKKESNLFPDCKWIWQDQTEYDVNHWVNIRRVFILSEVDSHARLYISTDTDYCLWINDKFVDSGQFSDYPRHKHYDSLNISQFLKTGKNCIAVLGYYQGADTSRYAKGRAGLIFALHNYKTIIKSDCHCKIRTSTAFRNGKVPFVTRQLGLTIEYDAGKDDNWTSVDYDDNHWHNADEIASSTEKFWMTLSPRPLPKLLLSPIDAKIIKYGYIKRNEHNEKSAAYKVSKDILIPIEENNQSTAGLTLYPDKLYNGCYAITDLGRESFGYLEIELTAAKGTIVDIAHGEHLIDKRVRCLIEDRNLADRYICAQGRQKWLMPVRRLGCRYLQLHFTDMQRPVEIHRIGLMQASYPIDIKGGFECGSDVHNKIYELCANTLELCMHEHYEDCPWREQAIYSADARNQALCGYYIFGEYDFPEVSLRLLGQGVSSDGFLSLCAPTVRNLTIPSFSMIWIAAIWEHCLYSGRITVCLEFAEQIDAMLKKYISMYGSRGLMTSPTGSDYWNFYEWTPALNGNDKNGIHCNGNREKVESCLNLFLLEAFEAAVNIFDHINDMEKSAFYSNQAAALRKTLSSEYMPEGLLPTIIQPPAEKNIYSQLTESLALVNNVLTKTPVGDVCRKIAFSDSLEKATLSTLLYVYKALMSNGGCCEKFVIEDIAAKWGYMLNNGATSCWETIKGAEDFNGAGSLCHGWSAVPMYVYYAYILGIKPLKPGFKRFVVNPYLDYFNFAKGAIPTPYGSIYVQFSNPDKKFILKHPKTVEPDIKITSDNWKIEIEKY
ncbi:MAG: hypothetical protein A2Y10_17795 [Planctomycetes bacterium GWF2_41_51]|nr:MAG: hypothetical protein A2Y10_17795 [Planctomycetes bacterium GWF2_41_51]HBG25893.1 hypothetical protein [Phycisphaerales bacterium]